MGRVGFFVCVLIWVAVCSGQSDYQGVVSIEVSCGMLVVGLCSMASCAGGLSDGRCG